MPYGIQKWRVQCRTTAPPIGVHQIEIPAPRQLNKATNPPQLNRDKAESVLACPQCGHVYSYTGSEAYSWIIQVMDQSEHPDPSAVCIVLPCAMEGCISRTEVRTAAYGDETTEQVVERLRHAIFHAACSKGHPLTFPEDDDFGIFTSGDARPF